MKPKAGAPHRRFPRAQRRDGYDVSTTLHLDAEREVRMEVAERPPGGENEAHGWCRAWSKSAGCSFEHARPEGRAYRYGHRASICCSSSRWFVSSEMILSKSAARPC